MSDKKLPPNSAGQISPTTLALRPYTSLTNQERNLAKRLRSSGKTFEEISTQLGKSVSDIEKSLSTIRTRQENPARYTLNIHNDAYQKISQLRKGDEPIWQTVNRILGIEE